MRGKRATIFVSFARTSLCQILRQQGRRENKTSQAKIRRARSGERGRWRGKQERSSALSLPSPPARFSQNVLPLPDRCTTIFQHAAGYPRAEALNWLVRLPRKRQPKPGERRIFVCFARTKVLSWLAKSPNKHQRKTRREFSTEAKCLLAGQLNVQLNRIDLQRLDSKRMP